MAQAVNSWSKEMFAAAVCQLLRDSRRRQKLTQAQVATRTGGLISKAALANYETGHRSLRVDVLWVIAQALGENLGTLVGAAERGLLPREGDGGGIGVSVDLTQLRRSEDRRLAPVRRWIDSQSQPGTGVAGDVIVLDPGAVAALSNLMGISTPECREVLVTVAGPALSAPVG